MDCDEQTQTPATSRPGRVGEEWIPLTRAAAELQIGYYQARELALRGRLELRFVRSRVFVSIASVEAFKSGN